MTRMLMVALVFGALTAFAAGPNAVAAESRKEVRAAPGMATVTLYTSKARDKVLRQVPAATVTGTFDVDSSSSSAISIRLGKELVWVDSFDVIVSDPGKAAAAAKQDCIVLSKGLKSDQSNMGLGTADCPQKKP